MILKLSINGENNTNRELNKLVNSGYRQLRNITIC